MTEHNTPIKRHKRQQSTNAQSSTSEVSDGKAIVVMIIVIFSAFIYAIHVNANATDPMYCRTDISDHSCYKTEDVCVCGKKACDKSVAFNNINGTFVCQDQSSVYCTADIGLVCVDSKAEGKKLENRVIERGYRGTGLDWVKTNRHDLDVFCRNREDSGTCQ